MGKKVGRISGKGNEKRGKNEDVLPTETEKVGAPLAVGGKRQRGLLGKKLKCKNQGGLSDWGVCTVQVTGRRGGTILEGSHTRGTEDP